MNLRCLKTIIAVAEQPSFFAAGKALGLSHSAVSQHIKMLEEELQVSLVDRSTRPPVLTERGHALVERAERMMQLLDEIASLGSDERLIGSLTVGVVQTAMINLLPPALAALRQAHPELRIGIRTGLSGELAQHVRHREIDVAVVTQPSAPVEGLESRIVAHEPLFVIARASVEESQEAALLASQPFIWFNRKSWAGQQIEHYLGNRSTPVREAMEVDSLEAIEALVRNGLGISIVPKRAGGPPFAGDLKTVPFGRPQKKRTLAIIERQGNPKSRLTDALLVQLRAVAGEAGAE